MTHDVLPQVRAWRHHLHQHPETAFNEHATSEFVASVLTDLGFTVTRHLGGTGLVGSLTRGTSERAIALRADMDALPLAEVAEHDHASLNAGTMHACGHDGHMAMLLGAAAVLARDGGYDGTMHAVFQPAEEPGRGAQAMVDDGLFDRFRIDAMYGLHNLPGLPVGHLHTRPGPIMASEDNFTIHIIGRGGHAARPDMVTDPIVIGSEIVLALQSIASRNIDPLAPVVVSCTNFETDGARNAIPGNVRITGDTRSFDPTTQALLERRIRQVAEGIAASHDATSAVTYTHEFAPTINDPACAQQAAASATTALGPSRVLANCAPIMPSEDFGVFATHVPACFAFIGNGVTDSDGGTPLHSRTYDFNDDALPAGVVYYTQLIRDALPTL
jgi:amidohydrolase